MHRSHVEAVVVDGEDDQRCLEAPRPDGIRDEGGVLPDQAEPHVREAAAELGRETGDQVRGGRAEHAEAERAAMELAHLAHRVARLCDTREDALRLGTKGAPRLGEDDAPADARQQLDPELGLELAHLLGERRLGDEERTCRRGEGAVLGRGEEVSELLKSHRFYLLLVEHNCEYDLLVACRTFTAWTRRPASRASASRSASRRAWRSPSSPCWARSRSMAARRSSRCSAGGTCWPPSCSR